MRRGFTVSPSRKVVVYTQHTVTLRFWVMSLGTSRSIVAVFLGCAYTSTLHIAFCHTATLLVWRCRIMSARTHLRLRVIRDCMDCGNNDACLEEA